MNQQEKRALFALWSMTTSLICCVGLLVVATHLGWYTREFWLGVTAMWLLGAVGTFGFALYLAYELYVSEVDVV